MQDAKRFEVLDSFRGLCALFVVVFHLRLLNSFTEWEFFRSAELFVEFFFILSGFVLCHRYGSRRTIDFRNFVISRTFRLLPLHWCMLGVFVVIETGKFAAWSGGISFNHEPFAGPTDPRELIPNVLLLQSWWDGFDEMSFNYPSWSISVEYYLYMIFAALILLPSKQRVVAWALIAAGSYAMLFQQSSIIPETAAKGLACFFAGALCQILYRKLSTIATPHKTVMTLLEGLMLLAVVSAVLVNGVHQGLVASGVFCLAVIVFARESGHISTVLAHKAFGLLGKLSYSIYLTHAAVLSCLTAALLIAGKLLDSDFSVVLGGNRLLDLGHSLTNNVAGVGVLVFVVVLSGVTYRYIEVPGQALGKRLLRSNSKMAAKDDVPPASIA